VPPSHLIAGSGGRERNQVRYEREALQLSAAMERDLFHLNDNYWLWLRFSTILCVSTGVFNFLSPFSFLERFLQLRRKPKHVSTEEEHKIETNFNESKGFERDARLSGDKIRFSAETGEINILISPLSSLLNADAESPRHLNFSFEIEIGTVSCLSSSSMERKG
jgi:hypothetical protein